MSRRRSDPEIHQIDTAGGINEWLRSPLLHSKEGAARSTEPDHDTYSIPARICLGVAIFGAVLLVAAFASAYLVR